MKVFFSFEISRAFTSPFQLMGPAGSEGRGWGGGGPERRRGEVGLGRRGARRGRGGGGGGRGRGGGAGGDGARRAGAQNGQGWRCSMPWAMGVGWGGVWGDGVRRIYGSGGSRLDLESVVGKHLGGLHPHSCRHKKVLSRPSVTPGKLSSPGNPLRSESGPCSCPPCLSTPPVCTYLLKVVFSRRRKVYEFSEKYLENFDFRNFLKPDMVRHC